MTSASIAYALANLTRQKRGLEADLVAVKAAIKIAEAEVLVIFAQEGTQSIKTTSGATCYLCDKIWASVSDPDTLRGTPFAWLIKDSVSTQSLSAEIRELPRDEDDMPILPEEVPPDAIKVTKVFKVGVRLS